MAEPAIRGHTCLRSCEFLWERLVHDCCAVAPCCYTREREDFTMKIKNTMAAAALAGALAVSLTGCATTAPVASSETAPHGTNAPTVSDPPAPTAAEAAMPNEEETPSESPAPDPEPSEVDMNVKFGQTMTWKDRLSVTVSKPTSFTPSEWASGGEKAKHHVKFTVTIVNKTGRTFDPSMFTATLQSGNAEADAVFDDGLEGGPMTKLLNGREVKFQIGFGANKPKDLVLEVAPSFEHDSAIFTY